MKIDYEALLLLTSWNMRCDITTIQDKQELNQSQAKYNAGLIINDFQRYQSKIIDIRVCDPLSDDGGNKTNRVTLYHDVFYKSLGKEGASCVRFYPVIKRNTEVLKNRIKYLQWMMEGKNYPRLLDVYLLIYDKLQYYLVQHIDKPKLNKYLIECDIKRIHTSKYNKEIQR